MDRLLDFQPLKEIDLSDSFFDSLREDYQGFDSWFTKKAEEGRKAFTFYVNSRINGFLFLKSEINQPVVDVTPNLPAKRWLKIGTFKITPHGTRLGERFLKKVFDNAIYYGIEGIYVTVFPKHSALIELFEKYGFEEIANKTTSSGTEKVFVKDLKEVKNSHSLDYPRYKAKGNGKFLLSIWPVFHTQLFPDSILKNESYDDLEDVAHTNSIEKVYISFADCSELKKGDMILIYRTSDDKGPAHYRSVITSVCVVDEVKSKSQFLSLDSYIEYCEKYSVFNKEELSGWYKEKSRLYVIKMLYNGAFKKKITRGTLITDFGMNANDRWTLVRLTDEQFEGITKKGDVYESLAIN